jgi:hypothetical protein
MFRFLFRKPAKRTFKVIYRPIPSTFCLSDEVKANSLYEANRLFDVSFPERQRIETFEI